MCMSKRQLDYNTTDNWWCSSNTSNIFCFHLVTNWSLHRAHAQRHYLVAVEASFVTCCDLLRGFYGLCINVDVENTGYSLTNAVQELFFLSVFFLSICLVTAASLNVPIKLTLFCFAYGDTKTITCECICLHALFPHFQYLSCLFCYSSYNCCWWIPQLTNAFHSICYRRSSNSNVH